MNISPDATEIIKISNLLLIGATINDDEIPAETMYYVEYYSMRRRRIEDEDKFKALFEGLSKLLGGLFKK